MAGKHRDCGFNTPNPIAFIDSQGDLVRCGYMHNSYVFRDEVGLTPLEYVVSGGIWLEND